MKFEKESFVSFLKSLKNGSDLIVEAITKRGSVQDENFKTAQKLLTEIKEEIKNKELSVEIPDNGDSLNAIDNSVKKVEKAIINAKTEEVTIKNAIEILKPSWFPKFEISLDPVTKFFEEIKSLLKKIVEKKEITLPIKNGRILVEVDRVGGGGGSNPVNTSHLATSDQQEEIIGNYATKVTISGAVTYVAKAEAGSSQSDAVWRAKKIDETSGIIITWADGDTNFDNVATDLTALTYS